ncbi:hypothetical protein DMUE_2373 [Dictyocoela muelleri]|nr:hypothetical protein DMUE_2373 [Dictyocoela muelleri]
MDLKLLNEIFATLKFFDSDLQIFIFENLFAEYMNSKQFNNIYKLTKCYLTDKIFNFSNKFDILNRKQRKKLNFILKPIEKKFDFVSINLVLNTYNYKYALSLIQNGDSRIEIILKIVLFIKLFLKNKDRRFLYCAWKLSHDYNFPRLLYFVNFLMKGNFKYVN